MRENLVKRRTFSTAPSSNSSALVAQRVVHLAAITAFPVPGEVCQWLFATATSLTAAYIEPSALPAQTFVLQAAIAERAIERESDQWLFTPTTARTTARFRWRLPRIISKIPALLAQIAVPLAAITAFPVPGEVGQRLLASATSLTATFSHC